MSEKTGKRFTVDAVYEDGVLRLLEPVELPFGVRVRVTIESVEEEARGNTGLAELASRLGFSVEEALKAIEAPEGLREALMDLIEHMAKSMADAIRRDGRLYGLYLAAERLEPGRAAERIGPPPLDNDTWMLMLSDILTVIEKAGLFDITQPLRVAANNRLVNPFDLAMAALRGDADLIEHEAGRLGARREIVYLVAAALAEATRRAVAAALGDVSEEEGG